MNKKLLALITRLVIASMVLAACSPQATPTSTAPATESVVTTQTPIEEPKTGSADDREAKLSKYLGYSPEGNWMVLRHDTAPGIILLTPDGVFWACPVETCEKGFWTDDKDNHMSFPSHVLYWDGDEYRVVITSGKYDQAKWTPDGLAVLGTNFPGIRLADFHDADLKTIFEAIVDASSTEIELCYEAHGLSRLTLCYH